MRVTATGNVGIGTTSPGTKLDIQGSVSTFNGVALALTNHNGGNTNPWVLGTGGGVVRKDVFSIGDSSSYKMTIFPNGFVGIGTTTPAAALDVRGDIKLGTTGQYLATGGEENLRIIRGFFDKGGNVNAGQGFTVALDQNYIGIYYVTFTKPFSGIPAVTASCENIDIDHSCTASILFGTSANQVTIWVFDDAGNRVDSQVYFIAIGPR